jgi:hypothetical protein
LPRATKLKRDNKIDIWQFDAEVQAAFGGPVHQSAAEYKQNDFDQAVPLLERESDKVIFFGLMGGF